jgi:DNA-binding MarR family transcriptional regulator
MNREAFFPLIRETMRALSPYYQESMQAAMDETSLKGPDWFFTLIAYDLAPAPLTSETVHRLAPYTSIVLHQQKLAETADSGFLQEVGPDTYQLTTLGKTAIGRLYGNVVQALTPVAPLPPADMNRLADLLNRVVQATGSATALEAKPMWQISRRTDPGLEAAAAARIDQYLTDLVRYRDDAHIAAWSAYEVDGLTWELFSYIWQEEANNLADLAEKLSHRGHTTETLAAAIDDLVQRGWVEEEAGHLCLTEKGQDLREKAETVTDDYFYLGWSALDTDEQGEMHNLLVQLKEKLSQPAATPVA